MPGPQRSTSTDRRAARRTFHGSVDGYSWSSHRDAPSPPPRKIRLLPPYLVLLIALLAVCIYAALSAVAAFGQAARAVGH